MGNSNMRFGAKFKVRMIAFVTAIMLVASMLSLTMFAGAEGAEYVQSDTANEYVPTLESTPESESDAPAIGEDLEEDDSDSEYAIIETPGYEADTIESDSYFESDDSEYTYSEYTYGYNEYGIESFAIGDDAIWSISHTVISPTATTAVVRVSLDQTTNRGMGLTQFAIAFDSPFLSNPRLENIWRLDFAAIAANPAMQIMYNTFSELGWTHEQMANDLAFVSVRYNASANHGTFHSEAFTPMWHFGPGGHNITYPANVFVIAWQVINGMTYYGHNLFVDITFDVDTTAANHYVGGSSGVRFISLETMPYMGPAVGGGEIPLILRNGSVTVAYGALQLSVDNIPDFPIVPTGQTGSGPRLTGAPITLDEGTPSAGWHFFGWVRGDTLPAPGDDFTVWQANNPSVEVRPANWQFNMPSSETTYTAIWGTYDGRNGNGNGGRPIVGGNLVINNQPPQSPRPSGQTATQYVPANQSRTLATGTAPTDLQFGRWVRGDVIPPIGAILEDWIADPANAAVFSTTNPNHEVTNFYDSIVRTYTAVWVCEDDIVGGGSNLIVNNQPVQAIRPVGQTPTQSVPPGENRVLAEGTAPADRYFGSWVRGDVIPPLGVHLDRWLALNPTVPNFGAGHRTATFVAGDRFVYTAVWVCEDGYVDGRGNLVIQNQPVQDPLPLGQTYTHRVPIGEDRVLAHGAAPTNPNLYFGRWIRGDAIPEAGTHLDTWLIQNPTVPNYGAGHRTAVFAESDEFVYTAIWVCRHGVVGGGGYRSIRIYYYLFDDDSGLVRDIDNNQYGRQYRAPIDSTFSLGEVLNRNDLDSDNGYYFEGWLVHIGGIPNQDYLHGFDADELHSSFVVPAPTPQAALAAAEITGTVVGDDISLVAVWSLSEVAEEEEEEQPQKALPQTGISSSLLLWASLLTVTLLLGFGVASRLRDKRSDTSR